MKCVNGLILESLGFVTLYGILLSSVYLQNKFKSRRINKIHITRCKAF